MSKYNPTVSVIIPTYNRSERLASTLACFGRQTFPKHQFEVIVVDDGSTDETAVCIARIAQSVQYPLHLVSTRRQGPGEARNLGIMSAQGEIILFTDSDCEPDKGWIENMVHAIRDPMHVVGGAIEAPPNSGILQKAINWLLNSFLGGMGREWRLAGFIPGYRLRTMNAAVHRKTLEQVGGFKCSGGFYAEDTELGERLTEHGAILEHCSDALVYHCENRSLMDYTLEAMAKGLAAMMMIRLGAIKPRGIYILPLCLVLLVGGIFLGAIASPLLLMICLFVFSAYCMLLLWFAIVFQVKTESSFGAIVFTISTFVVHYAYGVGTFLGLLSFKSFRKGVNSPTLSSILTE